MSLGTGIAVAACALAVAAVAYAPGGSHALVGIALFAFLFCMAGGR